jgi:Aerobic-type carbon monoxide dehydrogenase, large subunit CoxL/CutL homologs
MKNTFIGAPMERREDLRFLRGRGEYVDDVAMPGLLYAVDPAEFGGARPSRLDRCFGRAQGAGRAFGHHRRRHAGRPADHPDAAAAAAGVQAVRAAGHSPRQGALRRRADRGDLATSVAIGEDALEAIAVEIEDLPAVADWQTAAKNQSVLFEKPGTNRSLVFQARKGDADAAFANAPYTRREYLRTGRHYGLTMEPRGVMATWDDAKAKLTIYGAAKVPFFNRRILSAQIGLPVEQIEMIENDVGGGYGARGEFYPEDFLIPFAARHVKRPVKWIEDRRENLMAMNHAREEECDLEVACARDGTIPRHSR